MEEEPSASSAPATIPTMSTAMREKEEIPPRARSTATGSTGSSVTRPPALATGPAGTGPPPSSSVSEDCSTTRRPTPATGLRTWLAVRNTVMTTPPPALAVLTLDCSALCKDDANGNVPLGKSCNRYWACQGGYPRLQRCPAMLVFDKVRRHASLLQQKTVKFQQ